MDHPIPHVTLKKGTYKIRLILDGVLHQNLHWSPKTLAEAEALAAEKCHKYGLTLFRIGTGDIANQTQNGVYMQMIMTPIDVDQPQGSSLRGSGQYLGRQYKRFNSAPPPILDCLEDPYGDSLV